MTHSFALSLKVQDLLFKMCVFLFYNYLKSKAHFNKQQQTNSRKQINYKLPLRPSLIASKNPS